MAVASTLAWRLARVRRSAPGLLARHHRQPIAPRSEALRSIVAGDIQQACSLHKIIQNVHAEKHSHNIHKNIPLVLAMRYATTAACDHRAISGPLSCRLLYYSSEYYPPLYKTRH